jgi:hypothetical protein
MAYQLATNICSQCHLFAEPSLLDRATWRDKVKPLMRSTMVLAGESRAIHRRTRVF